MQISLLVFFLTLSSYSQAAPRFSNPANVSVSSPVGTLPVANGGTGQTSLTSNSVLVGNGTSAVTASTNVQVVSGNLTVGNGSNVSTITANTGAVALAGTLSMSTSVILGNVNNVMTAGAINYDQTSNALSFGLGTSSSTFETAAWKTWTPTFTGFSVAPTVTAKYKLIGKTAFWKLATSVAGTSNATNFIFTLPYASADGQDGTATTCRTRDNGVDLSTVSARVDTNSASTNANVYRDAGGGSWTNVGTKFINCEGFYEIQ